jgi:hypothetical protein
MFFGAFSSNLHFRENIREKLTKFRENQYTFRQNFRFRERSKKCFRPNPNRDRSTTSTRSDMKTWDRRMSKKYGLTAVL